MSQHSRRLVSELLCDVIAAVEKSLRTHGVRLDHAHKARLVGILYELMLSEAGAASSKLEAAADSVVGYERLQQRAEK